MDGEKKKRLFQLGLVEIVILIVVIIAVLAALIFFHVIPVPNFLTKFNTKPSSPTVSAPSQPVGIACPVSFLYCRKPVSATYQNQPALLYALKKGDKVFSMGKVSSYENTNITVENKNAKKLATAFIYNGKCYTATYILPASTTINKGLDSEFAKGSPIGTLAGDRLSLNNSDFNILLQLQVRNIDPKTYSKSEKEQCSTAVKQSERGEYVTPDPLRFD